MNLAFFNESGGLTYHLRAAWNNRRWQPFCNYVAAWLSEWRRSARVVDKQVLVLIGPNAGYTVPRSFVTSFSRVVVVEPDPVAYALFEARFQCRAVWLRHDYFDLKAKKPDPKKVRDLFAAHPGAAFLFCNFLGQLPVLLRDKKDFDVEAYMRELGQELKTLAATYPLASYHDRYSRNLRRPAQYIDHLTGELFSWQSDKKEFPWPITARIEHQIEFVRT